MTSTHMYTQHDIQISSHPAKTCGSLEKRRNKYHRDAYKSHVNNENATMLNPRVAIANILARSTLCESVVPMRLDAAAPTPSGNMNAT
eukprot:scaffold4535_cov179-Amphora_coffeaeformis.AAC.9